MAKNFNLQDAEKFFIFIIKDKKKASYYSNNVLPGVFTGYDSKSSFEFFILDCNI